MCTLEVDELVQEEEVVTTANKEWPHIEVFDRSTVQRLHLVGVEKARDAEMTYKRRLEVIEYASEERVRD